MCKKYILTIGIVFLWAIAVSAADAVPSVLIGEWQMSEGSGSYSQDPNTGANSAPNVNVYAYRIFPDGTYQHAALLTSSSYNCTMQFLGLESGKLTLTSDEITFEDQEAKLTSKDNCRPEMNYEKPGQLSRSTYHWRMDQDEAGEVLVLRWPNGEENRYHRITEERTDNPE